MTYIVPSEVENILDTYVEHRTGVATGEKMHHEGAIAFTANFLGLPLDFVTTVVDMERDACRATALPSALRSVGR